MPTLLTFLFALTTLLGTASAGTPKVGVVVGVVAGCDHFVVGDSLGSYAVLQDFYGKGVNKGDTVVGDFNSFGFKDLAVGNSGRTLRVWVDNYWMSAQSAADRISEKCRR